MCIIVAKPKGVQFPVRATLKKCFDNNDDGAGFAWYDGKVSHYRKGFMTFKAFYKTYRSLELSTELPVIFHFRIATAGGIKQGLTHPFPVCRDYKTMTKLEYSGNAIVAHNGILGQGPCEGVSDTMEFINLFLSDPLVKHNMEHPVISKAIEKEIAHNKLAVLDFGHLRLFGEGWIEENKVMYSNSTFRTTRYALSQGTWDDWKLGDPYPIVTTTSNGVTKTTYNVVEQCSECYRSECSNCEHLEMLRADGASSNEACYNCNLTVDCRSCTGDPNDYARCYFCAEHHEKKDMTKDDICPNCVASIKGARDCETCERGHDACRSCEVFQNVTES